MTREQVQRKKDDVHQQDQRAQADAKMSVKPEGTNRVIPEKAEKDDCAVKKVAVNVLQNKREARLTTIIAVRALTHGTGRRVHEERSIVSFAVVIAGNTEAQRKHQDQQRGRPGPPAM